MSKYFLWCRAWPWYLRTFPFDQFDELDEPQLSNALKALAYDWYKRNPAAVVKLKNETRRMREAKAYGQPTLPTKSGKLPRSVNLRKPYAATFEQIGILAGWISKPSGMVTAHGPLGIFQPSSRVYFHASDDVTVAGKLCTQLQSELPLLTWSRRFGARDAPLKYGVVSLEDASRRERQQIESAFASFAQGKSAEESWARRIADEAARLATSLAPTPPQRVVRVPSPQRTSLSHAVDFSWVTLGRRRYDFARPQQRLVVKLLHEHWTAAGELDGAGVSESAISEQIGSGADRFRMAKLFDGHPAQHVLIGRVSRGTWALYVNSKPSPPKAKPTRTRRKREPPKKGHSRGHF